MSDRTISIADADRASHRRVFGYDLLRAVAIILVMIDHGCGDDLKPQVLRLIRGVLSSDAVLFIMLSGALLLPVVGSYRRFVAKRFVRVYVPFLVWTVIYVAIFYLQGQVPGYWAVHMLEWGWLVLNFNHGWFVMVICSVYLFMPIISPWIATASRRRLEYFMAIWFAGGICPWIAFREGLRTDWSIFCMFATYIGFAIAGYYLSRYPLSYRPKPVDTKGLGAFDRLLAFADRHRKALIISLGVVCGVLFPAVIAFTPTNNDMLPLLTDNLAFSTYASGMLIFLIITQVKTLGRVADAVVRFVADNAYGMYLSHVILMHCVFRYYTPDFYRTTWMIPALIFSSLVVSALLRRIPKIGRFLG